MNANPKSTDHVIPNALRLAGDVVIAPGMSLIVDGQVGAGAARVVIGCAARAFLGPIGWLAVAADAYAKTTTGSGLLEKFVNRTKETRPADSNSDTKVEPPLHAEFDAVFGDAPQGSSRQCSADDSVASSNGS